MKLTNQQSDRAAGVLLGQAVGDALGVPYEFAPRIDTAPQMIGGGLGPYAPGEWSDDTQMAVCVARVSATGADLTGADALNQIARGFLGWYADGASDVGNQTRSVLAATPGAAGAHGAAMTEVAAELHARTGHTAGNGALMRTGVVGLTRMDDRAATARSARAVASLTHADHLAGDSCVLWSEAIRIAVVDGRLDLRGGLDLVPTERREQWTTWIDEAETSDPNQFSPNGFTVTALQAAWASVLAGDKGLGHPAHLQRSLTVAVQIGNDTDTVAAICGMLLGAYFGSSGIPAWWRRRVHGWPGLRAKDLVELAVNTAKQGGVAGRWPSVDRMSYDNQWDARRELAVPLPADPDVLLGTMADLDRVDQLGVDAVVSLCRLGRDQVPASGIRPEDHVEVRLLDSEVPADNLHLGFALQDAAAVIAELRAEGKRVLLHCVAAQQRTPGVAVAYAVIHLGLDPGAAAAQVRRALPEARGNGLLWRTALKRSGR